MKGCVFLPFLLLLFTLAAGQNRGAVKIENNGYKDILLSISEDVPENPELITRIKKVFTDTSKTLYDATLNRAYINDVTILIPKSWKNTPALPAARESAEKSDIVVDRYSKSTASANRPFTLKTTPCGENGHYIRLTDTYLLDTKESEKYGPYEKVMTHEWGHYRFGLFDEYQGDENVEDHFYAVSGGKIKATRCGDELTGQMYNRDTGSDGCKYVGQVPEPSCRFRDDVMQGKYASLMYKTRLAHLVQFCDSATAETVAVNNKHNALAPTQQNRQCAGKSAWEVMRGHSDFDGVNLERPNVDTTPEFRVVQQSNKKRVVLILDKSGSMNTNNRLERLGHGCSNYIHNVVRDGEHLGMVVFSGSASISRGITEINDVNREDLVTSIPTSTGSGTGIGSGLLKGLETLQNDGSTVGATLIVVSDGRENTDPRIADVFSQVVDAGVTVHTIAFTDAADSSMDGLAQATGGLSFLYSDSDTSNALNEAFGQIGEINTDPVDRRYTLYSDASLLPSGEMAKGTVVVDNDLGRETHFVIDYSQDTVKVTLTSPSGVTYDTNHASCKHDKTFKAYTFSIDKTAEPGSWAYEVSNEHSNEQRIALSVSSKSAVEGTSPIVAHAFWGNRNVGLDGKSPDKQTLYASVSKDYTPVLRAEVAASVERPGGNKPVGVQLRDDGAGADTVADDGIYSAYFLVFGADGRYNVKITVNSDPTTVVAPRRIIGRGAPSELSGSASEIFAGMFQRSASGGSFQLSGYIPGESFQRDPRYTKFYLPGAILDLQISDARRDTGSLKLTWTAMGDQLDYGQVTRYELRWSDDPLALQQNFSQQALVTFDMITGGDNLINPKPAGQIQTLTIKINEIGDVTYAFALRPVDRRGGKDVYGDQSNLASTSMADFPQVGALSGGEIAGIVIACMAMVAMATVAIALVCKKQQSPPSVAPHMKA